MRHVLVDFRRNLYDLLKLVLSVTIRVKFVCTHTNQIDSIC